MKYLIKFYYIGSDKYHGSQRQVKEPTIESLLIEVLKKKGYIDDIKNSQFEVASRTDKLVSARCNAFSLMTEKKPILMEINSALPKDIGLWALAKVSNDFSARRNAIQRQYKYIIYLPYLQSKYHKKPNLKLMKKACKLLEGEHDFSNFAKRTKEHVNPIRTLNNITLKKKKDFIIIDFKSRAFLRQQVRRMVAKILDVGAQRMTLNNFLELFDSNQFKSYEPADPRGLILWDIKYNKNIEFIIDQRSKTRMFDYFQEKERKSALKLNLFRSLQHDDFC